MTGETDLPQGGAGVDPRPAKSSAAFRTISEVADELDVAQHVLRFWESKFPQVRPLKRGGGRRYYRPEDVALLRQIRGLLYDEGYTIRGAQRFLRTRRTKPGDAAGPKLLAIPAEAKGRLAAEAKARASGQDHPIARAATSSRSQLTGRQLQTTLTRLRRELEELRDLLARAIADPGA